MSDTQSGEVGVGSMGMGHSMMMRMLFAMMDSDGDGTVSLQAMDANKDGRLTLEEIQAFMQGTRRAVPQQ
jgi:ABC-type Na+ transport system ATPase subunit NatA